MKISLFQEPITLLDFNSFFLETTISSLIFFISMKTKLFDTLTKLNLTPCRTYCTVIGAIGKNLLASPDIETRRRTRIVAGAQTGKTRRRCCNINSEFVGGFVVTTSHNHGHHLSHIPIVHPYRTVEDVEALPERTDATKGFNNSPEIYGHRRLNGVIRRSPENLARPHPLCFG
ncbi:hypothetical protein HanRHA438_Chr15g0709891 [Helianthus annuus]|uniref:Uncharacterized protein n=2 Tax=Helianthus annuus TaxID=4232 RepID=A0A9K3E0R5_HELAN|nr:uncharacterized protein LOC110915490 isoform X2 [Helianthus annuus]XP_035839761.1 uncharacterized protein LOC110915490 isoform X1 [Helianthus annuus]KAF5764926.1 hypothetical protein HanXRQr2_Chr15g0697661 [Helianthus annuus]KAJ0845110.1 hypothetical protein HanRHA438_Chr15g0709891 [Helianthus annuus]